MDTAFWRKLLYIFNLVTLLASLTLMGIGIWILNSQEVEMTAPKWAVEIVVAFGASMVIIALLGIIGTYKSPEYIVRDKCNFWMFIYQVLVLATLVITIVAAVAFLSLLRMIDDVRNDPPTGSAKKFEDDIVSWIRNNGEKWREIQLYLDCCSYKNMSDVTTATSVNCPTVVRANTTMRTCKEKLMEQIEDKSKIVGIIAVVVAFIELVTLLASCCVIWTKPTNEPRMSLAEQSYV